MKRLGIAAILGAALGLAILAQPKPVTLAPAEEEVKALREAWGKVLVVFEEFLVEFKGAVATLNSNDRDLFRHYQALSAQLRDLEAKFLQLRELYHQKIPALENSLSDCLGQIATLRRGLEDVIRGYKAADATLEAKVAALAAQMDQLSARVSALESYDIGTIARRVLSLEHAIQGVQIRIENNQEKIAALEKALGGLTADIAEKIATLEKAIGGLAADIGALKHSVSAVEGRVSVLESYDIGTIARRVLSLEHAIQAVQIKIENNREKIAALEKTLGGLTADIAALKRSVSTLEARVNAQEARLAAVEETMGANVQDLTARLDMVQVLAVLGLLAGIGAIVLILLGLGG
jgi:chromosome segregation ATPase